MGTSTRLAIIQKMADALGLRLSGQLSSPQGIGSSAFTDSSNRFEQDDYPNEGFLLTTGGTGAGQERRISDFTNASQSGAIYGTWASALDATTTYDLLLPPVTPAQYRNAINAVRSKIMARGIGKRVEDTSLVTTLARRYPVPAVLNVAVAEVYQQALELVPNSLWLSDSAGWSLHAHAALSNDGPNAERTLKLVATGAGERSYVELGVSPLEELAFFARVKGDGAVQARWQVQIYDTAGNILLPYATIGTAVLAATWTDETGTLKLPANAAQIRIAFDASGAGTVYSQAPQLMRSGDWQRIGDWKTEYDGSTAYLSLGSVPPYGRRLKLIGRGTLETLAADSDTLSLDEPELVAFLELAMAEAWRQFGAAMGLDNGRIDREIAKHTAEAEKLIGPLGAEWKVRRAVRTPRFGGGH